MAVTFAVDDAEFQRELNRFIGGLATWSNKLRRLEPVVQNQAAEIVAAIYRRKLRKGVGESLSPITKIIVGDRPALSTLADHVIVKRSSGGTPAVVTFEQGWTRVAFLLDRGYFFTPTPQQRRMLMAQIAQATGRPSGQSLQESHPVWIIPARPHIHLLNGAEMHNMLRKLARFVTAHGRLPALSSSRPEFVPFVPDGDITENIDKVSFALANKGIVRTGRTGRRGPPD